MTITELPVKPQQAAPTVPVVLKGISWRAYETLLCDLERSGQHMYLTYDRGTLEIMPPSPFHERYKKLIDRVIDVINFELDIPIYSLGSTTFRREDIERGLEPDECYYVQHEAEMGARETIDLLRDPPPDLAIEMDHTHHALDRDDIYAALGVPEIWQFDGRRLRGFRRNDGGSYEAIESSVAFPPLKLADIERFLLMGTTGTQDAAVRAFRDWLRQTHGRKS